MGVVRGLLRRRPSRRARCYMDATTLAIFLAVYAGMMLGEWPGLALDRTGIALLGAIMVLASGSLSMEQA